MNYIDAIVAQLAKIMPCDDDLLRQYALLTLTVGTACTNRHVHDAWATWRTATNPHHPSLVPYDQLTPEVQGLDGPYADAIRVVARTQVRAADLPPGTVVAAGDAVWIQRTTRRRVHPTGGDPYTTESRHWEGTDETRDGLAFDHDVDDWLTSGHAQILRTGPGGAGS